MKFGRLISVFLCLAFFPHLGAAQATGLYAFGPFDTPGFDTINRGNLNVHFTIPVFSKPGRGGDNFYYSLNYDGLIWSPTDSSGDTVWTPAPEWGWTDMTNVQYGYITYDWEMYDCTLPPHGLELQYSSWSSFVYHDGHGNSYSIPYSYRTSCGGGGTPSGTDTYSLEGNSGLSAYRNGLTFVIISKYGTETSVPTYMETQGYTLQSAPGGGSAKDTNGNIVSASYDSTSATGTFTDTMGMTALSFSGSAPNPVVYTYTDSNGHNQTVTMNYSLYTVQTAFGVSGVGEYNQSNVPLVSSIVYSADNSSYLFSYELTPGNPSAVTGRIASITLRTGGIISYSYSGGYNGIEPDGTVAGLTRTTFDGSVTYVRSNITNSSSTTTFTDASPAQNQTVSQFLLNGGYFYETDRSTYAGSAGGSTPLYELQTCYNTPEGSCSGNSVANPFATILQNMYQNGAWTDGNYQQYAGPGLLQQVFDGWLGTTYYDYNVYTDEYSVPFFRLKDSYVKLSSQLASETTYSYDEATPLATSGLPQHGNVTTTRGNLTSIHQWLNSSGNSTLNATYTYDDAGQVLTTTDTNNKATSFSYDTATDTLRTATTLPAVNGSALSSSVQYDTNTGLPISATDSNQQTTSYSYDGLLRPTQIQYPDGGKTVYGYTPTQTSTYVYQNSSTYSDTETLVDGYGRPIRAAVSNGQGSNSWYQQDTCYDANGNVRFASYRYQGNGWGTPQVCSGTGGDTSTYDALHRPLTVQHGDGTGKTFSYTAATTSITDESGATKLVSVDPTGKTSGVCEISSNASMPGSGSPGSCRLDIAGMGFSTWYDYDLVNHKVTITQDAQTRVFQTDWAGRPILVQEPESGQTTYSYAYNSAGLVVTRTRPQANQPSASVTTTTTTQYDALGRVVSINYSDGTPTKTFLYDASANWSDLSQTNLKGRLSLASVSNAATAYSYDPMGRVSSLDECLPSGCGTVAYNRQIHYTYDWAGNLLTSTDGGGVQSTYTVSPASEVLSLTSSLSNSMNPPNLLANVQNGPHGPTSLNLGNGLSGVYSYDTLGRLSGGWLCQGSTAAGCPGGTQVYGFTAGWRGAQLTSSTDSVLNQASTYGYDEFSRLNSWSVGGVPNYSYVYDRWGNRWQQNALQGGLSPQLSFNTATNQVTGSGYAYDAAGNMTSDGFHSYSYDAEGNITAVDSGSTAQYVYDALNHRVRAVVGGVAREFVFNASGQRVSMWGGSTHAEMCGKYYWGSTPVAFYDTVSGSTHFEHQDWLGTERLRTGYNGGVEATFTSLPFGDAQAAASGTDMDSYHYAMLDHDAETNTDRAQFRQYSNTQGRWLSPDPYNGSYDFTNPQSMNRYAYALNTPLSAVDPSGLHLFVDPDATYYFGYSGGMFCGNDPDCYAYYGFVGNGGYSYAASFGLGDPYSISTPLSIQASETEYNWTVSGDLMVSISTPLNNEAYLVPDPDNPGELIYSLTGPGSWIDLGAVSNITQMQGAFPAVSQRIASGAPINIASMTLLPSAPWLHQINKLMCVAAYNACMLGVGLANLECNIEKHLPASPIAPVSPIVCGDLTKQLEQAECSRQFEHCMSNSGGTGDDKVLPSL